ncbi:MAG TPA: glycosyltransferase family A protein [Alphaproteobacteria bacterium]|nr:glycosyltransferase family A protein [Alphaproteobacteria bacterium]
MISPPVPLRPRAVSAWQPRGPVTPRTGRGVIHIDLAAPFPDRIEPGPFLRSMAVFWWKDMPVGHVFLESHRCSPERVAALADSAVDDDLITAGEDRPAPSKPSGPVSVVICTRDRPQELGGCLDSLLAQKHPPEEIVVVDDGSTGPSTRRVATERPRTIYRRQQASGLGAARNTGIRAASHDIIAFTDDDVRHHPLWLERLIQPLEQTGTMTVTGLVLPFEMESEAQYVCERAWSFGRGYRARAYNSEFLSQSPRRAAPVWEIGSGASMAFKRHAFREVGGFDERLGAGAAGGSCDAELFYRLLAHGWTCRYEPGSVAYHRHPRDLVDLAEQVRARISGHVVALLIQSERHGHRANLHRVAIELPKLFLKLGWNRLLQGRRPHSAMLGSALQGYCAGLGFYAKHRRIDRT